MAVVNTQLLQSNKYIWSPCNTSNCLHFTCKKAPEETEPPWWHGMCWQHCCSLPSEHQQSLKCQKNQQAGGFQFSIAVRMTQWLHWTGELPFLCKHKHRLCWTGMETKWVSVLINCRALPSSKQKPLYCLLYILWLSTEMTEDVTFPQLQISLCLKHEHASEASPANRLGTDGRDRMIKKLLIMKGSDMSNQDEAFTCLHTQLVR